MPPVTHKYFSWTAFLTKTNGDLLAELFGEWPQFREVNFHLPQRACEQVPVIVGEMGDKGRTVEDLVQSLHDLSSERGYDSLRRTVRTLNLEMPAGLPGRHNYAVRFYLSHPGHFRPVWAMHKMEDWENWVPFVGREPLPPDLSERACARLRKALVRQVQQQSGGRRCAVYAYHTGDRVMLEISHESDREAWLRFLRGELGVQWLRPVLVAAASYHPETGMLRLRVPPEERQWLNTYRRALGEHLFGSADFFREVGSRLDLGQLCQEPKLTTELRHRIEWVQVRRLWFTAVGSLGGAELSIGAPGTRELYDALKQLGVSPQQMQITRARLQFKFPGSGNAGQRTVELALPDRTGLKERANDRLIEYYLGKWGLLDVQAPMGETADAEHGEECAAAAGQDAPRLLV